MTKSFRTPLTKRLYSEYLSLCESHNFPAIHIDNIDKVFISVSQVSGSITHMIFLWDTPSKMCMIGFPISNKKLPISEREGGLKGLLDSVDKYCKEEKYTLVWTTSGTKRVVECLLESGFVEGDVNVNQYIKIIS